MILEKYKNMFLTDYSISYAEFLNEYSFLYFMNTKDNLI